MLYSYYTITAHAYDDTGCQERQDVISIANTQKCKWQNAPDEIRCHICVFTIGIDGRHGNEPLA